MRYPRYLERISSVLLRVTGYLSGVLSMGPRKIYCSIEVEVTPITSGRTWIITSLLGVIQSVAGLASPVITLSFLPTVSSVLPPQKPTKSNVT